jgi:hypothetical protein
LDFADRERVDTGNREGLVFLLATPDHGNLSGTCCLTPMLPRSKQISPAWLLRQYARGRRTGMPRSILITYFVTALSLLIAAAPAPGAQAEINTRVTASVLQDQFDKPVAISQYEGRIVVIIASDGGAIKQNEEWENAIHQRFGDDLVLLRVADVRGIPTQWWKKWIKTKFQEEKRSILLDYDGVIFRRYGLTKNISNLMLIDRKGYIRFIFSGAATNAAKEQLFNEINKSATSQ